MSTKTESFVVILRTKLNPFLDDLLYIRVIKIAHLNGTIVLWWGGGGSCLLFLLFPLVFHLLLLFLLLLFGFCCCCCLFVVYRKVSYTRCISFVVAGSSRLAGVSCVIFLPGEVL